MYEAKTFDIPALDGLSPRAIEEHLGLYKGYVKHTNHILQELENVEDEYAKAEMRRRLGFEFAGMKNHEYYFAQFEGGAKQCPDSTLTSVAKSQFGSFDNFVAHIRAVAGTRGVGWTMCYTNPSKDTLFCAWVDEHHIGGLVDLDIVLALDMWEHAYMLDYAPSEKKSYVDAFFSNLNWEVVAARM